MNRTWLRVRLLAPPETGSPARHPPSIAELAPALICGLRSMDAGAEWHFRRLAAPDSCLEMHFRSHPAAIAEVESSLRRHCAERRWRLSEQDGAAWEQAAGVSRAEARLAGTLSALSSDLALGLLAVGGPGSAGQVAVAALHLRLLTALVPPADRLAFLFQCWQDWGHSLSPGVRAELARTADEIAPDMTKTTARLAMAPRLGPLWARYRRSLLAHWESHGPGGDAPRAYVLFQHAHLTHDMLGISPQEAAVAARALRSAMAADGTGLADLAETALRQQARGAGNQEPAHRLTRAPGKAGDGAAIPAHITGESQENVYMLHVDVQGARR